MNELAAALNDDANYAATLQNQLASKQKRMEHSLPDTGATASWIKIGTLTTSQGGYVTTMVINSSDGYDGMEERIQTMELRFTTSNNTDGKSATQRSSIPRKLYGIRTYW